ncbi:MAG: bifunctional phosphopantothenoylcysteine decarboxylase/phosphopantothenate--cysteine ligase CoaBC [Candidatus Heimdallarchaeaceae archaeon]
MSHISKEIEGTYGNELKGKTVLHCITSSISCFLSPQISRLLMRYGARVIPVLSPEAAKFINPLICEWATGEEPIVEIEGKVEHVKYAGKSKDRVDLILIAPITANSLSKIAQGIMDTSVTLIAGTALGNNIPMIIVPTMHEVMLHNPAVEENIKKLNEMGVHILMPRIEEGKVKIPSDEVIVEECIRILNRNKLQKKKILITAGPTRVFIDGIRFISNPSSGKMGYALALEAWRRGADVELVYGSTLLPPPKVIQKKKKVEKLDEMHNQVLELIQENQYDFIILAAAMNDFKPLEKKEEKISSSQSFSVNFTPVEKLADTIKEISPLSQLILFKAEYNKTEEELIEIAKKRLEQANAEMIIANDVSKKDSGFESDYNKVGIITFEEVLWVEGKKIEVAKKILDVLNEKFL